jgi:cytochrome c oxidase subunit 2
MRTQSWYQLQLHYLHFQQDLWVWSDWFSCSPHNYLIAWCDIVIDHCILILCMIIWIRIVFGIAILCSTVRRVLLRHSYLFSSGSVLTMESILSTAPIVLLVCVALPVVVLLYSKDSLSYSDMTVTYSVVAHQWYWSCEYTDFNVDMDMYMLSIKDRFHIVVRLLDVDTRLCLTSQILHRVHLSSSDVLHSFSIPSCNIKMDAIPGHACSINMWLSVPGLLFGLCMELCGSNHRYIPIIAECVSCSNLHVYLQHEYRLQVSTPYFVLPAVTPWLVQDCCHCPIPSVITVTPVDCRTPTTSCLIPTTSCLIPTTSCLIPTTSCLIPTTSCLIPTTSYQ